MKITSKGASTNTLSKFFKDTNGDSISLFDAYKAYGRDQYTPKSNKIWVTNKLTALRYHNLVKSIYQYKDGFRVLSGFQLTIEGKRVLGRIEGEDSSIEQQSAHAENAENMTISITNVMKIVAKLRQDNPDYEIIFDVKLKSG